MEDAQVIANQAKRIMEMEELIGGFRKCAENIHYLLFNIGAPLNDNIAGYTKGQLVTFSEIAKEIEGLPEIDNSNV